MTTEERRVELEVAARRLGEIGVTLRELSHRMESRAQYGAASTLVACDAALREIALVVAPPVDSAADTGVISVDDIDPTAETRRLRK